MERQVRANRANRKRWTGHTAQGKARLRAAAMKNKPWLSATGPRTKTGKNRTKMNALKHGDRSAEAVAARRILAELLRKVRDVMGRQT